MSAKTLVGWVAVAGRDCYSLADAEWHGEPRRDEEMAKVDAAIAAAVVAESIRMAAEYARQSAVGQALRETGPVVEAINAELGLDPIGRIRATTDHDGKLRVEVDVVCTPEQARSILGHVKQVLGGAS